MEWRRLAALFLFLGGTSPLSFFADEFIQSPDPNDGWKFVKETGGISFSSRARAGSSLKEFKAVGEIDASSRAVHNVLDDLESYPNFMPYTAECRLIKREGDSIYSYQRLSPKVVSDRDYTLRIRKKSWPGQGGVVFLDQWEPANASGPGEKPGVLRVRVNEGGGYWNRPARLGLARLIVFTLMAAENFLRSWPTSRMRSAFAKFSRRFGIR